MFTPTKTRYVIPTKRPACAAAPQIGTPICVPSKDGVDLGRIVSIELNHKAVEEARAGQSVALKIEATNATEQSRLYGRHFDHTDNLVSGAARRFHCVSLRSVCVLNMYGEKRLRRQRPAGGVLISVRC